MAINWMEPFDKITKVLKISGLWLEKGCSRHLVWIAIIVHLLCVEFFVVFGVVYLVNVQNIEDFAEALGVVPMYFVSCTKSIHFLYNKKNVESIMKRLKELIEHESWIEKQNGSKLKQRIRQIDRVYKTYLAAAMAGVLISSLVLVFAQKLPLKIQFPYDYSNNDILSWMSVAYQDIAGYYVVLVTVTIEIIPMYFMCYLTGITEELCDRIRKIAEVKIVSTKAKPNRDTCEELVNRLKITAVKKSQRKVEPKAGTSQMNELKAGTSQMNEPKPGTSQTFRDKKDENLEELLKCIEIQQKIKSLVTEVNDVFGQSFWFQGFISTFVLCATAFSLTIVSLKSS
jgi:7tm Odorant receptor